MKAILEIELIGDDTYQLCKDYRNLINDLKPGLGDDTFGTVSSPGWVAEITGIDSIYKFARTFLKGKKDYSRANSKGSRGIFAEYLLESGKYYEVNSRVSWKKDDRYFCTVNNDGDIVRVEEDELKRSLKEFTHSRFDKKLGIVISDPPSQRQTSSIFERMYMEKGKTIRCLGLLAKKLPGQDLAKSLEAHSLAADLSKDIENIGLWQGMEGAMKDYNYYADIVKTPHITYEYLLKGLQQWLKNRSESTSLQQPGNE